MGIQEKVLEKINDEEVKELWLKLYEEFIKNGKEGITKILEDEREKIKSEFEKHISKVEEILGGRI